MARPTIEHVSHSLMPVDENPLVEIHLTDGRIIRLELEGDAGGRLMVTYPDRRQRAKFIDVSWDPCREEGDRS